MFVKIQVTMLVELDEPRKVTVGDSKLLREFIEPDELASHLGGEYFSGEYHIYGCSEAEALEYHKQMRDKVQKE